MKASYFFFVATAISCNLIVAQQGFCDPATRPSESGDVAHVGATQTPVLSPKEVLNNVAADQKIVGELLGRGDVALKNPADRTAIAPKLIPTLKKMDIDLSALAEVNPRFKLTVENSKLRLEDILSVLGDKEATDRIRSRAASADPAQSEKGLSQQFVARWLETDKTVAAQTPLVDDLEKLDTTHPQSIRLTLMTIDFARDSASSDLTKRMLDIITDKMDNTVATSLKKQLLERDAALKAAADKIAAEKNKPFTITGVTSDGKKFSSADLKGKVVLVDFWATWCVPCKAELPRVKKAYVDYHDKGLEVVGVSNDYNLQSLKNFTAAEQMPWPELFDADGAANGQWNSITRDQGINSIPTMFLIDKKGVLRTVTARENLDQIIPKLLAESN